MIRESVQYVGQLSLAGSQWKVDQADQASRLQNMDNLEKEGERLSEALKGTVIQARSFEFPQSANQGIKDFSKPAGLGKDSIKEMTGRGTIDTGTDFFQTPQYSCFITG